MHEVEVQYGDYPVAYEMQRGPVSVTVYQDEAPFDPRSEDDCRFGEIILHMDGYTLGDEGPMYNRWKRLVDTYGTYCNGQSLAGALTERKSSLADSGWHFWADSPAEIDWNESADIRVAIPLRIQSGGGADPIRIRAGEAAVGQSACRKLIGSMLEDDGDRIDGIYIATIDDIRAEYGAYKGGLRKAEGLMQGQLEEYAAYVADECFWMMATDHNGEKEAYGLPIGVDYAEEEATAELERLYEAYVADVEATGDWAAKMGAVLPDTWITTGVAV